jgi:YcaO-like protein with predicted kinase domain
VTAVPTRRATAAERYLASFPPGEVVEFPVRGLDTLDVPLHSAALPASPRHPGGSGLGYGATPEQARAGALGEMAEMALSTRALAAVERVEASYAELVRRRGATRVQDPRTLALEAGSPYDGDRVLQWLPMTRLRDGESVLVPAELVASAPADLPGAPPPGGWLTTVITNGQGAAFDAGSATAHAVLEVLQRDGNATAFRAMDRGVVVDLDGLADPDALALLARLDAAGIDVVVKLASTDLGVVDVYAVGCSRDASEPVPVMATACGEAAHPDRDAAVRKALHEFAAARARKAFMHGPLDLVRRATPPGYLDAWLSGHPPERLVEEDRALAAMLEWTALGTPALVELLRGTVLSRRSTVRLADLPTWTGDGSDGTLPDHVVGGLHARGFDVLVHLQPSAGDAVAAKVLVPGCEVETLSYGRIGERGVARLRERDDPLVAVAADPGGRGREEWARVHLTPDAEERLGGPAWFDREGARRRVGPLYPLYREPGRHVAAQVLAGHQQGTAAGTGRQQGAPADTPAPAAEGRR